MNHAATLSPAVPRPAHVPAAAVYEGGHWMLLSHAANFKASGDTEYRTPLQQAHSPKAMLALEDDIRTLRWDA